MSDTGKIDLGNVSIDVLNGAALVSTSGPAGEVESIILTCDGADDVFTDPTAPAQAELYQVTGFTTGKRRVRATWLQQDPAAVTDIPFASAAVITVNAGTAATAVTRLTVANNGVGSHSTFKELRTVAKNIPVVEWNLEDGSEVSRIDVGFLPPVGTGAIPVRLKLEVW